MARADMASESDFTNAIIRLTRKVKKVIYVVKGHGEGDIHSEDDYEFKKIQVNLKAAGYITTDIFLPEYEEIPSNASALLIIDPKHVFMPFEIELMKKYVNKGGSILMLLENTKPHPELDKFLFEWGIVGVKGVIADLVSNNGNPLIPIVGKYFKHDITYSQSGGTLGQTYFIEASALRQSRVRVPDVSLTPLLKQQEAEIVL